MASLESILCTHELRHRPWRPPDYAKENRAIVALAGALAESPRNILQNPGSASQIAARQPGPRVGRAAKL